MHISVIGGGIMGLSIARSLRKSGHSIQLFEQSIIPNPEASSADDHRLIRYPYGDHEGYMHMVHQAFEAWDDVWTDIGITHYEQTGTLVISKQLDGWAADSYKLLQNSQIEYSTCSAQELKNRFPMLNAQDIGFSMYLPSGGALFASRILTSLKTYLLSNNVSINEHTRIHSIDPYKGKYTLWTAPHSLQIWLL